MTDDEAAVLRSAQLRATALATADWDQADALIHPRFVYTTASGARLDKAGYLEFLRDGPLRWRSQSLEDTAIAVDGPVAVLTARVLDDVEVDGEPMLLTFVTTQTYVQREDQWLYLAGHTAPPPE